MTTLIMIAILAVTCKGSKLLHGEVYGGSCTIPCHHLLFCQRKHSTLNCLFPIAPMQLIALRSSRYPASLYYSLSPAFFTHVTAAFTIQLLCFTPCYFWNKKFRISSVSVFVLCAVLGFDQDLLGKKNCTSAVHKVRVILSWMVFHGAIIVLIGSMIVHNSKKLALTKNAFLCTEIKEY